MYACFGQKTYVAQQDRIHKAYMLRKKLREMTKEARSTNRRDIEIENFKDVDKDMRLLKHFFKHPEVTDASLLG